MQIIVLIIAGITKKNLHTHDDVMCKSKRDKESDILSRFYIILQSNSIEANRIEYGNFALADISSFNSHFGNIKVHWNQTNFRCNRQKAYSIDFINYSETENYWIKMCVVLCTIAKYLKANRILWHVFLFISFESYGSGFYVLMK